MTDKQKAVAGQTAQEVQEATTEAQATLRETLEGAGAIIDDLEKITSKPPRAEIEKILAVEEAYNTLPAADQAALEEEIKADLKKINHLTIRALKDLNELIKDGRFTMQGAATSIESMIRQNERAQQSASMIHHLAAEIAALRQDPNKAGATLYGIYLATPETAEADWSLFVDVMLRADAWEKVRIWGEAEAAAEATATLTVKHLENLPAIRYHNTPTINLSGDRFFNLFFSETAPEPAGNIPGQMSFDQFRKKGHSIPLRYEKKGGKKPLTLYYDYYFNRELLQSIDLPEAIDDMDFFIVSVIDNMLDEGNPVVSFEKIWRGLGYDDSPNVRDKEELKNRLIRGMSTLVMLDDAEIQEGWKDETPPDKKPKEKKKQIISPVMPIRIGTESFKANGRITKGEIQILDYSPFTRVARATGHYRPWPKEILTLYKGRRTPRYWSLLHYLLVQIGWMTNEKSKRSNKILYSTLYQITRADTPGKKRATKTMLYKILDQVFMKTPGPNGISKYYEDSTGSGVTIVLTPQKKIADKGKK